MTATAAGTTIEKRDYASKVRWLILALSLARLVVAHILEIGNDEAYYWLYAQKLQWNYYDHTPMVAAWVRIFSLNLWLQEKEITLRLGSVLASAFASWFMYKTAAILHSERAGWYAAVLYNASFYAGVIAGIFIMPDSPQMLFWTFSLWMLARIQSNVKTRASWLLFGLSTGLCIMSKVHGAFLWLGVAGWIVFIRPRWLRRWETYAALLITMVVTMPFVWWNIENDFATYRLHGDRVLVHEGKLNPEYFIAEVTGQLVFNNPLNVALVVISVLAIFRQRRHLALSSPYLFIGLPLVLILLIISFSKPVFPHWSGPGYVSLLPLAAMHLAQSGRMNGHTWTRWALQLYLVFIAAWLLVTHLYPGTWGSQRHREFGKGDVTLDRFGWQKAGSVFRRYYDRAVGGGSLPPGVPVVCNRWWGAHIEYYFSQPAGLPTVGLGPLQEIGHYAWMNPPRMAAANLDTVICIVPSDEYYDAPGYFSRYYRNISLVHTIAILRNGKTAKRFFIYRLDGLRQLTERKVQTKRSSS